MIVHNETLYTSKLDFISSDNMDLDHWEPYTKHDYAVFNAFHIWVEFINRLTGVVAGIPVLLTLLLSFIVSRKKRKWWIFAAAIGAVFMMAFEAWLGKLVVDGNLIPGSITIHMVGGLIIIALLLRLRFITSNKSFGANKEDSTYRYNSLFSNLLIIKKSLL